jgi:hypothetical protein
MVAFRLTWVLSLQGETFQRALFLEQQWVTLPLFFESQAWRRPI